MHGVGFRATARSVAGRFPITGWVRNEPDGSVMLEVQGEASQIDAFVGGLQAAMKRNISFVSQLDLAELADERGFAIQH